MLWRLWRYYLLFNVDVYHYQEQDRRRKCVLVNIRSSIFVSANPCYLVSVDMAAAILGVLAETIKHKKESSEGRTTDSRVQAAEFWDCMFTIE